MLNQEVPILFTIYYYCLNAYGRDIAWPMDVEVWSGGNATLMCTSPQPTFVAWTHCPVDSISSCNNVNYKGWLNNMYARRFVIDMDCFHGLCNLYIMDVQAEDAGEYCCATDTGDKHCSNLTVLTDKECRNNGSIAGIITGSSCGLSPETVHHYCRITYRGIKRPSIHWSYIDYQTIVLPTRMNGTEDQATVESNLFIVARENGQQRDGLNCELGNSVVACVSEYETHYAYNSTTMLTATDGGAQCKANSSGYCVYFWLKSGDEEFRKVGPSLSFENVEQEAGVYTCYANCTLGTKFCLVKAMSITYTPKTSDWNVIILLILVTTFAFVMLAFFVVTMRKELSWKLKQFRMKWTTHGNMPQQRENQTMIKQTQ